MHAALRLWEKIEKNGGEEEQGCVLRAHVAGAVSPAAAGDGPVQVLPLLPELLHRMQEDHRALPLQRQLLSGLRQPDAAAGSGEYGPRRLPPHLPHGLLRLHADR